MLKELALKLDNDKEFRGFVGCALEIIVEVVADRLKLYVPPQHTHGKPILRIG